MTKSKEIIRTVGELIEHYTPWLIGLVVFVLAFASFYSAIKEIEDLELPQTEGALVLLFMFSIAFWTLGRWAGDNITKANKDDDDHTETAEDN